MTKERAIRIEKQCEICGITMRLTIAKSNRRFHNRKCQKAAYKIEFAGQNNPAYGKVYRSKATHPEWAENIKNTMIERQINVGEKNGMKRPEVAARMSATRKERFRTDPEFYERHIEMTKQAWASGKYDGVRVGQCDWHDHVKPDGSIVKCQGTWELKYARWMDAQGIVYDTHRGRIPYTDEAGKERSYYPDFYILSQDLYVDVKNPLYEIKHAEKLKQILQSNPSMKLEIVNKDKMKTLGLL